MNLQETDISEYIPHIVLPDDVFERKYIACRRLEKRLYTDEEVKQFPFCAASHPHYNEWLTRKKTFQKIQRYVTSLKKPVSILEIGCGNGWLSNLLSLIPRTRVTGIDINFTEIQQAARVFSNGDKLKFVYGDIRSGILEETRYDMILFAASIQYFILPATIELCFKYLKPFGEIHITDSPFYKTHTVSAARERCAAYYHSLGFPELADHYFHYTTVVLEPFDHELLFDPRSVKNRLSLHPIPFPWIRIRKKD